MADALVLSLTGVEAEGSDIPAAVPMENLTPETQEAGEEPPSRWMSYGPPWAHYLGGYQDRLLGGPLGLPGLRYTASEGVEHKDNPGVVLG
jgi:hypothetical protein